MSSQHCLLQQFSCCLHQLRLSLHGASLQLRRPRRVRRVRRVRRAAAAPGRGRSQGTGQRGEGRQAWIQQQWQGLQLVEKIEVQTLGESKQILWILWYGYNYGYGYSI